MKRRFFFGPPKQRLAQPSGRWIWPSSVAVRAVAVHAVEPGAAGRSRRPQVAVPVGADPIGPARPGNSTNGRPLTGAAPSMSKTRISPTSTTYSRVSSGEKQIPLGRSIPVITGVPRPSATR